MMFALLVAVGAAIGAPMRFGVERLVARRSVNQTSFLPWALVIVNGVGSFILGAIYGRMSEVGIALVAVGFCGTLTTFSGFAWDIHQRISHRALMSSVIATVVMLIAAFGGFVIGYWAFRL